MWVGGVGRKRHEMTYNQYEPGARLGRHLSEHHEETKGTKGWFCPSRRSVTWLVHLNEDWNANDGGALCCFPHLEGCISTNYVQVGADDGNLQMEWITDKWGDGREEDPPRRRRRRCQHVSYSRSSIV